METKALDRCRLTMYRRLIVRRATLSPQSFRILIFECESVFVGCCCFGFFFLSPACVSELTSVHVSPQKVFLCNRGRKLRKTETNIRNLGLGAKNKNEIRPLVKLDSPTVLRKLNYVDNDALVQLYYLWMKKNWSADTAGMHSCLQGRGLTGRGHSILN